MKLSFVLSGFLCCLAAAQNALSPTSQEEAAAAAAAAKLLLSMPKCGVCAIYFYSMDDFNEIFTACLSSNRRSGVSVFTNRSCMLLHKHDAPGASPALRSRELFSQRLTQYAAQNTL